MRMHDDNTVSKRWSNRRFDGVGFHARYPEGVFETHAPRGYAILSVVMDALNVSGGFVSCELY